MGIALRVLFETVELSRCLLEERKNMRSRWQHATIKLPFPFPVRPKCFSFFVAHLPFDGPTVRSIESNGIMTKMYCVFTFRINDGLIVTASAVPCGCEVRHTSSILLVGGGASLSSKWDACLSFKTEYSNTETSYRGKHSCF